MTEEELKKAGWHQWYNKDYWVHPDIVKYPKVQDYTMYGMSLEEAIEWEKNGRKKISHTGLSIFLKITND